MMQMLAMATPSRGNSNAQRVFDFLRSQPDRTPSEMALALGLTRQQVRTAIALLMNWGCFEPEPRERRYRLADGAKRPTGNGGTR